MSDAPTCPVHGTTMRHNANRGDWFCSRKAGPGEASDPKGYCKVRIVNEGGGWVWKNLPGEGPAPAPTQPQQIAAVPVPFAQPAPQPPAAPAAVPSAPPVTPEWEIRMRAAEAAVNAAALRCQGITWDNGITVLNLAANLYHHVLMPAVRGNMAAHPGNDVRDDVPNFS